MSGASINAFADLPKDAFPACVKRIRVSKRSFRPVAQPKAHGILWWPSFLLHVRAKYECAFERCMAQAFLATAIVLTVMFGTRVVDVNPLKHLFLLATL